MKKNSMIIGMLLLATVIVCVGIRMKLKPSYLGDKLEKEIPAIVFSSYGGMRVYENGIVDADLGMYHNEFVEVSELVENADVVLIGKLRDRIQIGKVFNTEIEVIKTIKGASSERIHVFEPAFITSHDKIEQLELRCGYVPIAKDEQYVFFLHREPLFENTEQYNLLSIYAGKFRISESANVRMVNNRETISLHENPYPDFVYDDQSEELKEYQRMCEKEGVCEEEENLDAIKRYISFDYNKVHLDVQTWLKNEGELNE